MELPPPPFPFTGCGSRLYLVLCAPLSCLEMQASCTAQLPLALSSQAPPHLPSGAGGLTGLAFPDGSMLCRAPSGREAAGARGWCIPVIIIITCVYNGYSSLQSKCFSDASLLFYRRMPQGLFGEVGGVGGREGREPTLTES